MQYRFKAECPRCNSIEREVVADRIAPPPVVHCGDCLMDRTEVVRMTCTLVEVRVA